ncbi:MAG: aldo/keto reductase [Anaerolineales bacterium]
MEYVNLGASGLRVSQICLGMMSYGTPEWREYILPEADSLPLIRWAVEAGINFFDTANMYSLGVSEEITGKAIREYAASREEVVVATKVYFQVEDKPNRGGLSRKHIMDAIDASLQRLNMDYVDLYQIHRWDYNTPIEETMEALHDVVKAGKARYIGASSMFAWQFAKAQHSASTHGWTRFVSMQNHYNLIYREEEREMIPLCRDMGVGLIPWSPLARGFLAGNRSREGFGSTTRAQTDTLAQGMYYHDADFEIVARVQDLAERHGVSAAQIALAWVLHQPGVVAPIVGASKLRHLEESVMALDVSLSEDDLTYLGELYQPKPLAGHR